MAMGDRIKSAAEEAAGKVKQAAGKATGNDDLQAQGQADQASAEVKKAGDKIENVTQDALDS